MSGSLIAARKRPCGDPALHERHEYLRGKYRYECPGLPDLRLLQAVDDAADDEGWALASQVRFEYDGSDHAQGYWAKRLYAHDDAGLLEHRPTGMGQFKWGLTAKGGDVLYA